MTLARAALVCGLLVACVGARAAPASAHLLRGTAIFLDVGERAVDVEMQIPIDQLALALQRPVDARPGPLAPADDSALRSYVAAHLAADAGQPFTVDVRGLTVQHIVDGDCLVARATLRPAGGARVASFVLRSDVVLHRVVTHKIYVLVRRDVLDARIGGEPALAGILKFQVPTARIDRAQAGWGRGMRAVFSLGVRHIAEGTDHLLFLFMFLLVAPLGAAAGWRRVAPGPTAPLRATLRRTVRVVTAFTIGHSASLVAAVVSGARAPGPWVEVLIAISILVTAIHALHPLFPSAEPLIAGLFGLVHGLAFSAVLTGLGFDGRVLAWSVLGFNLGVEAMQLVAVAVVLGPLVLLSKTPWYPRVRVAGALFGVVAAAVWIAERGFGVHARIPGLS